MKNSNDPTSNPAQTRTPRKVARTRTSIASTSTASTSTGSADTSVSAQSEADAEADQSAASSPSNLKKAAAADSRTPITRSSERPEVKLPNRAPDLASNYQLAQNGDRIAIFIDGSNLFYAASHLNIEVDYRRLLSTLVRGRRLLRAYFYTGVDPQNEKQRGFLLWLNRHGHRVVSKELTHMPDGSRKANMHVEMAVDMMRIAEHCTTLTLLGGDGNLAYALQVLSQRGVSIEVVSLQSMTSDSLIDLADSYTDLADLRDQIKR
ncbi:NYN domain-containing protein [Leptolyngbya sp. BC1307]|uniref:LabA-like NYN domain-containing protein n=1 Tax=Leptolyngbya sp. BC1307 TaxID=2029589 RepID=UPI000EFCCF57|nr:NYN domain-containing protein [Leptolyngbya sp. BC1307]